MVGYHETKAAHHALFGYRINVSQRITQPLVQRHAYQQRPTRYAYGLTKDGQALISVLQALCVWGNQVRSETWKAPEGFMALKFEPESDRKDD